MSRMMAAVALVLFAFASTQAHFTFVLPEADGNSAKVVFSDELKPDASVNVDKIANTKLTLRDSAGKEWPLEWKKEDGYYSVSVPGTGSKLIYGTTDYGVVQNGNAKPFKLVYYPKAIVGSASSKEATVGSDKLPLEIVAFSAFGKVRFQVLASGKPAPEVEVAVLLPGTTRVTSKTNKDGYTVEFEGSGRYGVTAKSFEAKSGDYAGKKFEEIRNYATLVCDIGK